MSSAFARLRRRCLPSKRKLDDYASSLDSSNLSSDDTLNMRKPSPFSPSSIAHDSASGSSSSISNSSAFSCPPSSSSSSSSSSTLHFFVRFDSKTLVLHASPLDTVDCVLDQIRLLTRISVSRSDHRLIYRGRQLDPESTLADSSVETDACLHLTARLRSTRFPRAWRLVDDLFKSVECLIQGKPVPREISSIDNVITEFLTSIPEGPRGEIEENTLEYLQVFVYGCAPAELVKLYLSNIPSNRIIAERAVRFFLNPLVEFLPKPIHIQCWRIVLEFCKMIAGTAGKNDHLYISCRSTLGSLLEAHESGYYCFGGSKSGNLVVEILPYFSELVEIVVTGLSADTMFVSSSELGEFANLVVAMKRAVQDWLGGKGQISKALLNNSCHGKFERWIYSLFSKYMEILDKVEECLKKIGDYLTERGSLQSDMRWTAWSHILVVITNMHSFSKIYEGAPELLHRILLHQRVPINALIRHAKKNANLRWLLKYKDVTDFESRRSLALMLFPAGKDDYERLHEMLIDRSQLLAESFEYIGRVDAHALHGGLFMEFKNEEATGPGVLREWFCLVCQAIFNPQNVLFLPCPNDRRRFFPNPGKFFLL